MRRQGRAKTFCQQRLDQPLPIRALLLDGFDVKAQARERLGEELQVFAGDHGLRLGVFVDLLLAQGEELHCVLEAEHLQRTHDLPGVLRQRREVSALFVITEKRVEHLLHVSQVGLDLARDLRQKEALLRPTRHLVEHRRSRGGRRPVLLRCIEPGDHRLDLSGEIRRQRREILDGRFGDHGMPFGS